MTAPARQSTNGKFKRRAMLTAKIIILVLVVAGIGRAVNKGWAQLVAYDFRFTANSCLWMLLSSALYIVALLPLAHYWYRLLSAMDRRPRFWATMRAYFLGHLGKYVPGKAMVVVLRTGALPELNSAVTAISVFAETLSMMAVGAFLASTVIAIRFADQTLFLTIAVVLMLLAGLPTIPPVFRVIVLTLKVDRLDGAVESALRKYTWPLVISGWLANLVGWFVMALSLWAVLRAFPQPDGPFFALWEIYPQLLASVCLAVVAGFLSLLPGGVGVRELVFNELLADTFDPAVAILCPVLLRLTWLCSELVAAGLLQLLVRRKPAESSF